PWLRSSYPLLYSGDALVAVPGIAAAACDERKAEPRWRAIWNKGGKLG
ncbi:MAG: tRNA(Ile)-lysidine synthetase, partial [Gammaproteobacteria bacterium]|nr:tRNA(Ile)-lysidine synthetase [Gammaproteobacteria bacterium]